MGPRTRSQSQASKSRSEGDGSLNTRIDILEQKFEEVIEDIEKSNRLVEDKLKIMASVIKNQVENKIESKMRSEFESMTEILKKTLNDMNSTKNNPASPENSFVSMNFKGSDIPASPGKVSQEQETTQFKLTDNADEPDGVFKSDLGEPSRFPNGDFNLQIPFQLPQACTAQEKRILDDWPEVVLPSQAKLYGATSHKNRVTFAPGTCLSFADSKVLPTLAQIQEQLKTALIPYQFWAMRLVSIMNEDFQQVATWAKRGNPTWLDLVEAIIQVLKKHQTLYSQMTQFARMAPKYEEDKLQFLRHIRNAYYQLPSIHQSSLAVKEAFRDHMQQHLPLVLLHMGNKLSTKSTADAIEEAMRINTMLARELGSKFNSSDTRSSTLIHPTLESTFSSSANEPAFPASVSENHCFLCKQKGHWANNCPTAAQKKSQFTRPSDGQPIVIKGTLYKNQLVKFSDKLKNKYSNFKNRPQTSNKNNSNTRNRNYLASSQIKSDDDVSFIDEHEVNDDNKIDDDDDDEMMELYLRMNEELTTA